MSLKEIFLKEKVTSNTLIKKLREIILAFKEENREWVIKKIEAILGY